MLDTTTVNTAHMALLWKTTMASTDMIRRDMVTRPSLEQETMLAVTNSEMSITLEALETSTHKTATSTTTCT